MKITLLLLGKTTEKYLEEGISIYASRLKHYLSFQIEVIPELKNTKNLSVEQQKQKEAELIMKNIRPSDFVILLDERGKLYTSVEFATFMEKNISTRSSDIVFIVGGPYGVDETIFKRADSSLSLSKMTFSHQMIRLFFTEQLYRAMTILKNEPYHHQ